MENETTLRQELLLYAESTKVATAKGDLLTTYLALSTLVVGNKRVRPC